MRTLLLLALVLAGCASKAADTPQAQCARQADEAPQVQEMQRIGAGSQSYQWDNQQKLQQARQDATVACLRARGLAPKGGVERPRS